MSTRRNVILGASALVGGTAAALAGRRLWLDRDPAAPAAIDPSGRTLWSNWSGLEHSYPAARLAPANEAELAEALARAAGPVRAVGAGHSFTGLVTTDATLLSLDRMSGLIGHDPARLQATVHAGTRLSSLGALLEGIGQEMTNLPDINKQSLAGAIATGTHGSGHSMPALHGNVIGLRLVTPSGEVIDCDANRNADVFQAARVGLGAFGVISAVTLQNSKLTRLRKRAELVDTEAVLESWTDLVAKHRNLDFQMIPFTGKGLLTTYDETTEPVHPRPPDRDTEGVLKLKQLRDLFEFTPGLRREMAQRVMSDIPPEVSVDAGWKLLSNERTVRFKEMEYQVPVEAQVKALREVLHRIETNRDDVFFPIEVRTVAADDAWLSPFYQRDCGPIAIHAYYKDDHDFFFGLAEPVLRAAGGRPHWGKLHSLRAPDLARLYPRWEDAQAVRRKLDPQGKMLNPYLRGIFG